MGRLVEIVEFLLSAESDFIVLGINIDYRDILGRYRVKRSDFGSEGVPSRLAGKSYTARKAVALDELDVSGHF
jgi:hypothetical protein